MSSVRTRSPCIGAKLIKGILCWPKHRGTLNLVNPKEIALREDGVSTLDQDWAAFRMSRMIDGSATVVGPNAFALHLTGSKPRNQSTDMVDSTAAVDDPNAIALRLQDLMRRGIGRTVQGQPQARAERLVSDCHLIGEKRMQIQRHDAPPPFRGPAR